MCGEFDGEIQQKFSSGFHFRKLRVRNFNNEVQQDLQKISEKEFCKCEFVRNSFSEDRKGSGNLGN